MNIFIAQYIEINFIGILVIILMLSCIMRVHHTNDRVEQRLFVHMLASNAIILATDLWILLLQNYSSWYMITLNHIMCVIYYLLHAYFGYLWFRYCLNRLIPEWHITIKNKILVLIPHWICNIIVLASPWTGWIYTLSVDNNYSRGKYMWIVVVLSYLYWVAGTVVVLYEFIRQRKNRDKSLYLVLLFFPIPTIIGNIIQINYYGLSIIWVCSAFSLLTIFIEMQNKQLSHDILTGLYNRRQTSKQIDWEINHLDNDSKLYVVMIDIDHFKSINDKYGHVIGDKALIDAAELLKKCAAGNAFLGRFGGDEFIIIGHSVSVDNAEKLIENIYKEFEKYNIEKTTPYTLCCSAGYAVFTKDDKPTIDSVISAADKEMYRIKAEKNGH